jgi:hypothetical protein
VRPTNSQTSGTGTPLDGAPGSHLARRRASDPRIEAVTGKRREESGPPTKPSIVPPSPRPAAGRPLGDASPLVQLERTAPTLTYRVVAALAGVALGLGALMISWSSGRQPVTGTGSTLWFVAVSTLIFSSLMAIVITLSFMRRLRVLSESAFRLAQAKSDTFLAPPRDPLTSLALSVTRMSERSAELLRELEQCVEEEQARVDELVRERTRSLARESDDYRRLLGETKAMLTIDRDGRVLGHPVALESWFGSAPRAGQFWEYFERAATGAGPRFEAAWERATARSGEPDLEGMPLSLSVGHRQLALEYKSVLDGEGKLDRVLVLLSDVTIPEPDPATTSRHLA